MVVEAGSSPADAQVALREVVEAEGDAGAD